jgi:uncharacterized LabA/DUF88 family protein
VADHGGSSTQFGQSLRKTKAKRTERAAGTIARFAHPVGRPSLAARDRASSGDRTALSRLRNPYPHTVEVVTARSFVAVSDLGGPVIQALEGCGFEAVAKRVVFHKGGTAKANMDIELANALLEDLHTLDLGAVLLVSGDGDFADSVARAQRMGAWVDVTSFRGSLSRRLASIANRVPFYLDDLVARRPAWRAT